MKRSVTYYQPCVVFHRSSGDDIHVEHGTEEVARRNAAILGPRRATFHVHEHTRHTVYGWLREKLGRG